MKKVRRYFLTGIIILAPLGVTLWILYVIARFIVEFLHVGIIPSSITEFIPAPLWIRISIHGILEAANFLIGLFIALVLIMGAGALVNTYVGRKLIGFGESLIERIPFIRSIYNALKQFSKSVFTAGGEKNLNRVVLIEYPRKGIHSLGFVTGKTGAKVASFFKDKKMANIFIPSTPNPTTGYYLIVPEEDVREVDLSVEDALKLILSGGFASPEEGNSTLLEKEEGE